MKRCLLIFVAVVCAAQGLTLVTNHYQIQNHGGHALSIAIGADQSDEVKLDIRCDHPVKQWCFFGPPTLDGIPFHLFSTTNGHQEWRVSVTYVGDHIVAGNYPWLGVDVHYDIEIVAVEAL
jgi:hypothetical protein